jgi:hypothetical protein
LRWRTRPRFLGAPAFYEDPNDHNFRYINNIEPQNEQENVNLSLKGDWDLGFATLTGYIAWNDQKNFFLTDGTSGAFSLYAFEATGTCPATNDASLTDPGYEPPFFGIPSSSWSPAGAGFSATVQSDDLRWLSVSAARPAGRQHRGAPDVAG